MTTFALRCPPSEIGLWENQYRAEMKPDEEEILSVVVPAARLRGWLSREELLLICRWKSPRSGPYCARNESTFIRSVTEMALSTPNERLRIEGLNLLDGVSWPTASAILHLVHHDRYPILDVRALWSVGVAVPHRYTFPFWEAYTTYCRCVAAACGVTMRMLDRALYRYAVEYQPTTAV